MRESAWPALSFSPAGLIISREVREVRKVPCGVGRYPAGILTQRGRGAERQRHFSRVERVERVGALRATTKTGYAMDRLRRFASGGAAAVRLRLPPPPRPLATLRVPSLAGHESPATRGHETAFGLHETKWGGATAPNLGSWCAASRCEAPAGKPPHRSELHASDFPARRLRLGAPDWEAAFGGWETFGMY